MNSFFGSIGKFLSDNAVLLVSIAGVLIIGALVVVSLNSRDASNLNSGTVSVERLSPNVALYNGRFATFNGRLKAAGFIGNLRGDVKGNADTATALASDPSDCQDGEFAVQIDAQGNLSCSRDGSSLVDLNASRVAFGTLSDNRLTRNVAKYNDASPTFTGVLKAAGFVGNIVGNVKGNADTATQLAANPSDCTFGSFANSIDAAGNLSCSNNGSSLTTLNASNISSGTLNDARLSNNVPLKDADNTFTGINTFTNPGNVFTGALIGNADTATELQNSPFVCNPGEYAYGIDTFGDAFCDTDGSGFTNLNASEITSGTLADARLSSNVALQDAANVFTGANSFGNAGNTFSGSFTGNLTGNADTATALAATPSPCAAGEFANSIASNGDLGCTNDGSSLTNLDASNINSGTLGDAYLSSNVALLDATNTFTAVNTFTNAGNSFTGSLIGNADTATALQADPSDCAVGSFSNAIAANGDLTCSNDGTLLTNLDADNISAGTIGDSHLSANVTIQGNTFNGASQLVQNTVGGLLPALNGSNLTALNASNLSSGTLSDGLLSGNVTLQGNTFNGVSQLVQLDGAGKLPAIDGSQLTGLTLSQISGVGTLASQNAVSVAITGGSISGVTLSATSLTSGGAVDFSSATSVKLPQTADACDAAHEGNITYGFDHHFYGCNGTTWLQLDN